jgi:hypothetical protein
MGQLSQESYWKDVEYRISPAGDTAALCVQFS